MEASRDLKQGEIIFEDFPFEVGTSHEPLPMCLGCFKAVSFAHGEEKLGFDDEFPCHGGCGFPMCSEECPDMSCHSKEECSILREFSKSGNRDQHSPYQLIYPLRFFLLWQNDPMKFSASNGLMDHMEERKEQHYQ